MEYLVTGVSQVEDPETERQRRAGCNSLRYSEYVFNKTQWQATKMYEAKQRKCKLQVE